MGDRLGPPPERGVGPALRSGPLGSLRGCSAPPHKPCGGTPQVSGREHADEEVLRGALLTSTDDDMTRLELSGALLSRTKLILQRFSLAARGRQSCRDATLWPSGLSTFR